MTSTELLEGKRILVVGGARRMGAEIASRLDAEVLVAARDLDRASPDHVLLNGLPYRRVRSGRAG
jgi:NAD(P)-dependent dehydrogenase (short-subunit alcohol dehydrogenase family)